jgi:hypothetical protein
MLLVDDCLVEVARRECSKKGSHGSNDLKDANGASCSTRSITSTSSIESKERPCTYHYRATQERFGSLLDNLGCICNVLLSLNLESCCVIPSHLSTQPSSPRSSAIERINCVLLKPQAANSSRRKLSNASDSDGLSKCYHSESLSSNQVSHTKEERCTNDVCQKVSDLPPEQHP